MTKQQALKLFEEKKVRTVWDSTLFYRVLYMFSSCYEKNEIYILLC